MGSAVNCYWIINISKSTAVRYKRPTPEVTLMSSVWYSVTSEKVKWKRSENVESLSTYGWFWVALVAPTALQFANSIQPASEPKSPKHDAGHAVQDLKGCMREQCSVKAGLHYVAVNWLLLVLRLCSRIYYRAELLQGSSIQRSSDVLSMLYPIRFAMLVIPSYWLVNDRVRAAVRCQSIRAPVACR